jgi:hypothetical protein
MTPRALPDRLRELLEQASLAEVPLCTVDEAGLLAVGWAVPSRGNGVAAFVGQASPHDFPGLEAAQQRLIDAGLAQPGASDTPAAMTTTGGLRDYLDLCINHRLQHSIWSSWARTGLASTPRLGRRVTPVRETSVAVFERIDVPVNAPADVALRIAISLLPVEAVAAELTELAYRDPTDVTEGAGAPGTEAVFIGPDRKDPTFPSVLRHDWHQPTAVLEWRYFSLFHRRYPGDWVGRARQVITRLKPDQYRKHLIRRLRVPEPPLPRRGQQ